MTERGELDIRVTKYSRKREYGDLWTPEEVAAFAADAVREATEGLQTRCDELMRNLASSYGHHSAAEHEVVALRERAEAAEKKLRERDAEGGV